MMRLFLSIGCKGSRETVKLGMTNCLVRVEMMEGEISIVLCLLCCSAEGKVSTYC